MLVRFKQITRSWNHKWFTTKVWLKSHNLKWLCPLLRLFISLLGHNLIQLKISRNLLRFIPPKIRCWSILLIKRKVMKPLARKRRLFSSKNKILRKRSRPRRSPFHPKITRGSWMTSRHTASTWSKNSLSVQKRTNNTYSNPSTTSWTSSKPRVKNRRKRKMRSALVLIRICQR